MRDETHLLSSARHASVCRCSSPRARLAVRPWGRDVDVVRSAESREKRKTGDEETSAEPHRRQLAVLDGSRHRPHINTQDSRGLRERDDGGVTGA